MTFHSGAMGDVNLKRALVAGLVFAVATQLILPRVATGPNKILVGTAVFAGMMYITTVLLGDKFYEYEHATSKAGALKHCVLMPDGNTKCFDS